MNWSSPAAEAHEQPSLPDLLAEYGRLVAKLSSADPAHAECLRERLGELDNAIDTCMARLGLTGV